MKIEIPGYKTLSIQNLLLDYNGTIAKDGVIPEQIRQLLCELSHTFRIYVLTADTHGTASKNCRGLPVLVETFPSENAADFKLGKLLELGARNCACIGNGRNDCRMLEKAALSIAVLDAEGMYPGLLKYSDLLVRSSEEALSLFLHPRRIIAGLRG